MAYFPVLATRLVANARLHGPAIEPRRYERPTSWCPLEESKMLKAEEVQAILRVYDHLEKYIRNNFPTLSDDEVMRKLQDSLRSRPLRKYLEEKDEIDEVRIRANPGLDIKRWYER